MKNLFIFIYISVLLFSTNLAAGPALKKSNMKKDVIKKLNSEFHKNLLLNTYNSIVDRQETDGFFQETMSAAYPGMYPRTTGALTLLFLELGLPDRAELTLNCVLDAAKQNKMKRIPHIFERRKKRRFPKPTTEEQCQLEVPRLLFKIDGGFKCAQPIIGTTNPLKAVEFLLSIPGSKGEITMQIVEDINYFEKPSDKNVAASEERACGLPIKKSTGSTASTNSPAATLYESKAALPADGKTDVQWVRFEISPPLKLKKNKKYYCILSYPGPGAMFTFGMTDSKSKNAGVYAVTPSDGRGWVLVNNYELTFAADTGKLKHEIRDDVYPIVSRIDQIDGQGHIIMAWAKLAQARCKTTPFENKTYNFIANLMDSSTELPYFDAKGEKGVKGLVLNPDFEHSRDGRMWKTYDFLSQSFIGSALENMIPIAKRRGDKKHVASWSKKLKLLKSAIDKNMTFTLDGKRVYLEMLLPEGNAGIPYTNGLGWVNLAPLAAQWEALDRSVLDNTIVALRKRGLRDDKGKKWLIADWAADPKKETPMVIIKGVGWELDYSQQKKEWKRIIEWLDFLESRNSSPIIAEAICLNKSNNTWSLNDPGNGEQACWWVWGMVRLRKELDLPPIPAKPDSDLSEK